MERAKKKNASTASRKGLLGVRSTIKLFNFKGQLWSDDEDGNHSDEDFEPGDEDILDEDVVKPVKRSAAAKRGRARKAGPPSSSPSKAKRGRKKLKEPYYDAETQELVEEAVSAFEQPAEAKFVPKNLSALLMENSTPNVTNALPGELMVKILQEVVSDEPKQTVHNLIR